MAEKEEACEASCMHRVHTYREKARCKHTIRAGREVPCMHVYHVSTVCVCGERVVEERRSEEKRSAAATKCSSSRTWASEGMRYNEEQRLQLQRQRRKGRKEDEESDESREVEGNQKSRASRMQRTRR